jgi:hypothetical protein
MVKPPDELDKFVRAERGVPAWQACLAIEPVQRHLTVLAKSDAVERR